ncbi:unnamed protein product [Urochloa decumbens]|uniref:Uncharacterized protein n=1 Tax=Urochloa decumbens TaxID=240449 RepID=A0ABC8VYL8_9POAL
MINRGMVLFNIFEEPFGDIYPKGVWGRFRKSVSSKISRSVVALSSFIGETRFFACTGVFIDFDDTCLNILTSASLVRTCIGKSKIVGNLKIEVLLPNNRCEVGTLKHYSLHYNVALVSVKKCCASPPAVDLKHRSPMDLKCERINTKVVAVGWFVQSGTLMAANGKLIIGSGKLDCRILSYSTCKITKAGIGGPLVDLDGNFVGMNFHGLNYHCKRIGTPFLNREDLCGILEYFKTKNTKYPKIGGSKGVIVEDVDGQINKWPVPYSCWRDPSDLKKDRASYKHAVSTGGCPVRYSRSNGF